MDSTARGYCESFLSLINLDVDVEEVDNVHVKISGMTYRYLQQFLCRHFGSINFSNKFFGRSGNSAHWHDIKIHNFFIPEFVYLLQECIKFGRCSSSVVSEYNKIIELLQQKTWFKTVVADFKSTADFNRIKKLMTKYPLDYQIEFIGDIYSQRKQQYRLNGYLLSLEQGLGKTLTSLFLKEAMHIKHAIVVCPLSTVGNVWEDEIRGAYKDPVSCWTAKEDIKDITANTEFVVINYEGIDKILDKVVSKFNGEDTIVIVDECHNFKDIDSLRTKNLIKLCDKLKTTDILLMSGTPVKALSTECLPIFKLLDTFYDKEVENLLKECGRYPKIMNELLHNRLGLLMFRRLKAEVLNLPEKHEEELKIKINTGKEYTLESVKTKIVAYSAERREYYSKHYPEYEKTFFECLNYYEHTYLTKYDQADWMTYKQYIEDIHSAKITSGMSIGNPDLKDKIQWVNAYDREKIIPNLPAKMRNKFRDSRTVYKYVELKILGEVIGNLLNRLRIDLTSKIIGKEVMDIIRRAKKKTILFSSYTDSIRLAEEKCRAAGFKPMVITGENSNEARTLVDKFKKDPKLNPLIASLKVMSTGHTINEANTVIFLNVPFRSVDYEQASDRCYRIGQDTDVYIYKLVLDTDGKPNLSTRMQDILAWSKDQFGAIVDGKEIPDDDVGSTVKYFNDPDENIFEIAKSVVAKITKLI